MIWNNAVIRFSTIGAEANATGKRAEGRRTVPNSVVSNEIREIARYGAGIRVLVPADEVLSWMMIIIMSDARRLIMIIRVRSTYRIADVRDWFRRMEIHARNVFSDVAPMFAGDRATTGDIRPTWLTTPPRFSARCQARSAMRWMEN